MLINLIFLCIIALSVTSVAAENKTTFFRDGALFQQEKVAVKGVIGIHLAADLLENTLTIIPATGCKIISVETSKAQSGGSLDKEIEALTEQRRRLEDRLQALETREAIFTSAAKAQSGKAPRKTKANPDPMQAIRQGTDFAIAQLEAVYTARRRTAQEIQKTDVRLATARKGVHPTESIARVMVTPPNGKVTIRYATTERGWQPQYNLHLTGDGTARLQLNARISGNVQGQQVRVSPGSLSESTTAKSFTALAGSAPLADYILPVTEERFTDGIYNRFSGRLNNNSPHYLQPGEFRLFRSGSYLGTFRFEGISSGRSKVLSMGI
ncbi:MAG: hypothetical protein WCI45_14135 [Desulfuromonadales bacterium]